MKFELTTSGNFYTKEDADRLKKLGIKFEESNFIPDKPYYKASGDASIKIENLKQLIAFVKEWGPLVVDENSIEIYDDYRE